MSQKVCKPSCLERTDTWWQKYHSDLSEQEVQETQLSRYLPSPETPGFSSYELWGIFKILVLLQHVLILRTILIISKASESFLPLVQEVVYTLHLSSTGCWQCLCQKDLAALTPSPRGRRGAAGTTSLSSLRWGAPPGCGTEGWTRLGSSARCWLGQPRTSPGPRAARPALSAAASNGCEAFATWAVLFWGKWLAFPCLSAWLLAVWY